MSDGSRFVGFDTKQQKKMSDMLTKKRAIEIKNCEVKHSRRGDKWRFCSNLIAALMKVKRR